MGALTKADIAENLVDQIGISKKDAKDLVEGFFDVVRETLVANEQVKLSGFGNFEVREKNQRPGRNPKTGEKVNTPEKKTIHFKMSKDLFKKLNDET